jgi:8-oxo-dGTP pyrophosphatase MutT (NUDIX family)
MNPQDVDKRLNDIKDCLYRCATKVIIADDHKLLVVLEKDDMLWNLPGGGIDHGEDITDSIHRELQEEVGLTREDVHDLEGPVYVSNDGILDSVPRLNIFYRATVDPAKARPGPDAEEIRWVTPEELLQLDFSPPMIPQLPKVISLFKQLA